MISAVGVLDPPRPPRAEAHADDLANPYRGSSTLWRIHAVSVLLVAPQCLVWTFTLVWLMTDRGWSAASAGAMVTFAQILGAAGRIAAGRWSDKIGSRLHPIRTIAIGAAIAMGLLAVTDLLHSPLAIAVMVVASVITVSDNGLAFTAIAELAGSVLERSGPRHAEHQLNCSPTGIVPPVFGALIAAAGYPAGVRRVRAVPVDRHCRWCPSMPTRCGVGRPPTERQSRAQSAFSRFSAHWASRSASCRARVRRKPLNHRIFHVDDRIMAGRQSLAPGRA